MLECMMVNWLNDASVLLLSLTVLGNQQTASAQPDGTVRLVDGPSPNCGRVEVVYDGEWSTLCNDDWKDSDICKRLGYERGVSQTFDLAPLGTSGWGVRGCLRTEDVGVCCDPRPRSLPVRVACPKSSSSVSCKTCPDKLHPVKTDCRAQLTVAGVVEVQVNGVWGPISAQGWDTNEATVVCGQLGYPISFPSGATPPTIEDFLPAEFVQLLDSYLQGSGAEPLLLPESVDPEDLHNITQSLSYSFLQGVECSGTESQLLDCSMSGVGPRPNPTHTRVAAVKCGFNPHYNCLPQEQRTNRMRAGAVQWAGRPEIKVNGEWGTICETGFDVLEGNVICRRLGYGSVKTISGRAGYGRGVGKVHFTQTRCLGTEERIEDCESTRGRKAQRCGHSGDVGIECNIPSTAQCSQDVLHNVAMMEEGGHTYPQIRGESGWGIFCHSNRPVVTREVGEVICRQTRRQFLARISKGARPADYDGVCYSGNIHCTSSKLLLSECDVSITQQDSCPGGYTTVDCTSVAADLVPDVSKLQSSLTSEFAIQVHNMISLQCAYDEGCLSSSARPNGYPRTLLRFDSMTWNWGLADFEPTTPSEDWTWHSCHSHYHSMEEFVHYDLLYVNSQTKVAEGHKASFCLEDSSCARNYHPRFNCYGDNQAISPNCGDLYGSHLDCQWIDITGVRLGEYLLQMSVNPQRLALESDYRNNQATCRIQIRAVYDGWFRKWRKRVDVQECWLSDH